MKIVRFCSFALAAAVAVGGLTASRATAKPKIVNGGFEDPAENKNSITEITETGIPGWTGDSIGGNAHEYLINGNVKDLDGRKYGKTPYGAQYLGLNAVAHNSFTSIESQTVKGFKAGTTYEFSLEFADLDGATDSTVSIVLSQGASGSGKVLDDETFTAPVSGPYGTGKIEFNLAEFDFTPDKSGAITFSIGNLSHQGTMGIDDVKLTTPAAVPEPASTAAVLLGLGALAGVASRRRVRQG